MTGDRDMPAPSIDDADQRGRQLVRLDAGAVALPERDSAESSTRSSGRSNSRGGRSGTRRRRSRSRSRNETGGLTDDPFEQGMLAVGAGILFAFLLHMVTPGSGFFSHLPSGWLGLFPVLLCFEGRALLNKLVFGMVYLGIWFFIAGLINAASKGLVS